MPSPVSRIGRGLTALTFDHNFPRNMKVEIRKLFEQVGSILEIPDSQFDAFTVTFSPSHSYHALAALATAGERMGLNRKNALTAAAHALADGILSWREGEERLDKLIQEAATPGGTAAATMQAMDSSGYMRIIEKGLRAGRARARNNAKLI
jgi:pyrroline-5-carboxylate reductase